MIGVPNPYFQLINSYSRPGKTRFRAKAVNTNSNREIPPTIREVTNIRPKITVTLIILHKNTVKAETNDE